MKPASRACMTHIEARGKTITPDCLWQYFVDDDRLPSFKSTASWQPSAHQPQEVPPKHHTMHNSDDWLLELSTTPPPPMQSNHVYFASGSRCVLAAVVACELFLPFESARGGQHVRAFLHFHLCRACSAVCFCGRTPVQTLSTPTCNHCERLWLYLVLLLIRLNGVEY